MKQIFLLLLSFLALQCFSQSTAVEEKGIGKTAAELILVNCKIDINSNQQQLRTISSNDNIGSEFDFISYFKMHENVLFKEDSAINLPVLTKEEVLAENYLSKTNVVIISVNSCTFRDGDLVVENSYCLTVKEEKRYFFEDNLTSIQTAYHYYWYSCFFRNYLSHYSRSILHTPEGLVINYSESINKNPLSYLEQSFLNKDFYTVRIYPNPASQYINIQYVGSEGHESTFELVDATEKTIKKIKPISSNGLNTFKIDVNSFSRGFYILKGTINKQPYSIKLILE